MLMKKGERHWLIVFNKKKRERKESKIKKKQKKSG